MKVGMMLIMFGLSLNANAMFCPTNFKSIDFGDTLEHVLLECGNPTSQKNYKNTSATQQEWDYYIKTNYFDQSNTKLKVLFKDEKVVNINITEAGLVNKEVCESTTALVDQHTLQRICNKSIYPVETNVVSSSLCGQIINVGDNIQKIEMACGKPAFVKQMQQLDQPAQAIEVAELHYEGSSGATLIFINGRLSDRHF